MKKIIIPLIAIIFSCPFYSFSIEQFDSLGDDSSATFVSDDGYELPKMQTIDELIMAAEQGDAEAQYVLAKKYHDGDGIGQDHAKAKQYVEQAAEKGHVGAQAALAYLYFQGLGTEQDHARAAEWYTKAAELRDKDWQYNREAQYKLAKCYDDGFGVEKDIIKAKILYRKASDYPEASKALNDLLSNPANAEILKKHKKNLKEYKNKAGEFYRKQYSMSERKMRKWISETSDEEWEEYMLDYEPGRAVLEIEESNTICIY